MLEFFDKIFIINLEHRIDRKEYIISLFEKYNITNYEFVKATKLNKEDIKEEWYRNSSPIIRPDDEWNKQLKDVDQYFISICGCKHSHRDCLLKIKEQGLKNALILEDDIDILEGCIKHTIETLKTFDKDWDMLYLGGAGEWNYVLAEEGDYTFQIIDRFIDAHAYAVSADIAEKLANEIIESGYETDRYYEKLHKHINAFCIKPFMFYQRNTHSDITDNMADKDCTII